MDLVIPLINWLEKPDAPPEMPDRPGYSYSSMGNYLFEPGALVNVLKEVTASEGQIVLFIDEIHTVVGAGATGGSTVVEVLPRQLAQSVDDRAVGGGLLVVEAGVAPARQGAAEVLVERDGGRHRRLGGRQVEAPALGQQADAAAGRAVGELVEDDVGAREAPCPVAFAAGLHQRRLLAAQLQDEPRDEAEDQEGQDHRHQRLAGDEAGAEERSHVLGPHLLVGRGLPVREPRLEQPADQSTRGDIKQAKYETTNQGAYNADNNIAEQAKPTTFQEGSG